MNRPLFAWSIFGICLVLTFAAVSWLTRSAWQADQERQQALLESEIQNALWQMDSLVAPLLAIEINRPSLSGSFSNTPVLDQKLIKGYVVRDASGRWTIRRNGHVSDRETLTTECPLVREDWAKRLAKPQRLTSHYQDAGAFHSMTDGASGNQFISPIAGQGGQMNGGGFGGGQFGGGQGGQMGGGGQSGQIRSQLVQQFQQAAANSRQQLPPAENPRAPSSFTPLQPVWIHGDLVFARQTPVAKQPGAKIIEICWLNWKEWEALLSAQLEELSIPLQMQPCHVDAADPRNGPPGKWQMVSLPIRLEPKSNHVSGPWPRPLIAVWGLLFGVAIAFGWLMRQTLNLSERRAAFVSAVTHELRTPLTTFRLYTEMLSEGLASDPEQQKAYFQTLHREANRLTHLVENVLAYARLEHGRSTARNETLTVGGLIDRIRPRLEQRVADTPLSLSFQFPEITQLAKLTTNAMAVEQILFNLIDNSCKYARDATDPRIICDVRIQPNDVCIAVSDFGPGLSTAAQRTLFQPFQKSSSQAAESAPGIGLGLALSHRLAHELQGSLRCHPNRPAGLCFELQLPLERN